MPRRISPKPESFPTDSAHHYWHMAADIAFEAGVAIYERDGACWLVRGEGECSSRFRQVP